MMQNDNSMALVWAELRNRYSLLQRLIVHSEFSDCEERFPLFFGLILSVIDKNGNDPCCIVLPRRGQIAQLAATIFGMEVFLREFHDLARLYAEQSFSFGQKVRVHPGKQVYNFGGLSVDEADSFELCTLDKTGTLTIPIADVLRLEVTDRIAPIGRLGANLAHPEVSPVDELLGVRLHGNLSLIKNRVICLDEQAHFKDFTSCLWLQNGERESSHMLSEVFPFGKIKETTNGTPAFENWSNRHPRAEPLVAVTSSSDLLSAFCRTSPERSKFVIINGFKSLSNLQAFDEISECQRVVIFADENDQDRMGEFEKRGCKFWIFGDQEFFSLKFDGPQNKRATFGNIFHRAGNLAHLKIQSEVCESEMLNAIALVLEGLHTEVNVEAESNPHGKLGRIAQRLWRILNEAAAMCCEPTDVERVRFFKQISDLDAEVKSDSIWLKREVVKTLDHAIESFKTLFEIGSGLGINKGASLRRAIALGKGGKKSDIAVLARNETQAQAIKSWLRLKGLALPTFSLATVPENACFDRLIVVSWLGSDVFRRLIGKLITDDIVSISYDFEARWLIQCKRRISQRSTLTQLSPKEKANLIWGDSIKFDWPEEGSECRSSVSAEMPSFDVWTFEKRLSIIRKGSSSHGLGCLTSPAKYVSFVGDKYALLTQWHKVPVVTTLLGGNHIGQKAIPERVIDSLKSGDLVVFPEGGQKAVIAGIADQLIGVEAKGLRSRSRIWRDALRSSKMTPEKFLTQVGILGQSRHVLTIRNWFFDESQIGPKQREDLDLIAVVTESVELEKAADDVWEAILFLRSNHLAAGSALRDAVMQQLRESLTAIEENGSRIEIPNLGAAWVVMVDAIATEFTEEPRNQLDRLLSDQ